MKQCFICKKSLSFDSFHKRTKSSDGLAHYCKDCARIKGRGYYESSKKTTYSRLARNRKLRSIANRIKLVDYQKTHPCVDCGETDFVVLTFDHVRGEKVASLSRLVSRGTSWSRVQSEIDKCEVRCANCHARKTAKERGYYKFLETMPL